MKTKEVKTPVDPSQEYIHGERRGWSYTAPKGMDLSKMPEPYGIAGDKSQNLASHPADHSVHGC